MRPTFDLPSLQRAKHWIEKYPEQLHAEKLELIDNIVSSAIIVEVELRSEAGFHRLRALRPNEKVTGFEGAIWPSTNSTRNRAESDDYPAFYISNTPATAVAEALPEGGKALQSVFYLRENRWPSLVPIGELYRAVSANTSDLGNTVAAKLIHLIESLDEEEQLVALLLDNFLRKIIDEDKKPYEYSKRAATMIHRKCRQADGLAYSSTKQRFGVNYALRRDRFWNYWGLLEAQIGHIHWHGQGIHDMGAGPSLLDIGDDGTFVWSPDDRVSADYRRSGQLWIPAQYR